MINEKIKAILLIFIAFLNIDLTAHSDESKSKVFPKQSVDLKTTSSRSISSSLFSGRRNIEEVLLEGLNINGLGLISMENTKLPDNLWTNSSEKALSEKLDNV